MMFQFVIFNCTTIVRKKKKHMRTIFELKSILWAREAFNKLYFTTLTTLSISYLMYVHSFIYSGYIIEYYVPLS